MNTKQIKTICFVFVLCSSFSKSFSQESKFSSGFFAGENCTLTDTCSVWAMQTNPALLPFGNNTECGVAYSTNYMATDLVCTRVNACTKMKQLSTAVSATIFGNTHFRESFLSGSIARKLNTYNALAIKFTVTRQYQEVYTHKISVYPEFSYCSVHKKLSYGIHIVNPLHFFRQSSETLSSTKMLMHYRINNLVAVSGMFLQQTDYPPMVSVGVAAKLPRHLQAGISYSTQETPITLLLQIPLWRVQCYYETAYNYYLGMNHTIGFAIKL